MQFRGGVLGQPMTDATYRVADPVVDCAQGRPMVVVDTPGQTVAEWSEANSYDLTENYANGKFDPDPDEAVVECVYVSDLRSEPSKTYTFPVSRVRLIDVHHADDGARMYDRVARDVLETIFANAHRNVDAVGPDAVAELTRGIDPSTVDEARELADVEQTVVADE